jgi:haloalkane dehalogenase
MAQDFESNVSSDFPFTLQRVEVLGSRMTYVDTGSPTKNRKEVALFLHGNPTSSYYWRNVIPHVSPEVRCIAPDLIGFGQSGKPDIAYRFVDHVKYLEAFISAVLPTGKIIIVAQDWGTALGFNWAYLNQNRIVGLAFSEFLRPYPTWDDMRGPARTMFEKIRDPVEGRALIIEKNIFIEKLFPTGTLRPLTEVELDHYRAPFLEKSARQPMYQFPNEIPIEGHPVDVLEIVEIYSAWLLENDIPKLFFWAKPGRIVTDEKAKWCLEAMKNIKGIFVGEGLHYLEEDHPHKIGGKITDWLSNIS